MYREALRRLGNPDDAEDAVQEIMLRILRDPDLFGAASFGKTETRIPVYLRAMIRNLAIDRARRERRLRERHTEEVPEDLPDEGADTEKIAVEHERRDLVRRALTRLPEGTRDVVRLIYYDGLSCGEAARILGITPGAVRGRLYRAKKTLRKELKDLP